MLVERKCLIEQAKTSRKLPNVVWAIFLTLVFMNLGSIIGVIALTPLAVFMSSIGVNENIYFLLLQLLSFAFISFLVFFRVKTIEKRNISSIGFSKNNFIKKYLFGFTLGIAEMALVVIILLVLGFVTIEKSPIQPVGISAIGNLLIILLGWIIQGGTEEVLTRGWLMNVLGARYNVKLGLIVSSVLFGALHLLNPNVNYIAVINIILVGFLFGIYVLKTNDLWGVCGMHSAWNFAQGNIFGFEVSGIDVAVGTLFDLNLKGNELITGGAFGPEAGLVCTFVLILFIFVILKIFKNEGSKNNLYV